MFQYKWACAKKSINLKEFKKKKGSRKGVKNYRFFYPKITRDISILVRPQVVKFWFNVCVCLSVCECVWVCVSVCECVHAFFCWNEAIKSIRRVKWMNFFFLRNNIDTKWVSIGAMGGRDLIGRDIGLKTSKTEETKRCR